MAHRMPLLSYRSGGDTCASNCAELASSASVAQSVSSAGGVALLPESAAVP